MNYDNPNPNVSYGNAMRETFLVSGRPHSHHAHSYHSIDCKQGQFQSEGGGASIDYGHLQDITPVQNLDDEDAYERATTQIPITAVMSCGPVSPNSLLGNKIDGRRRISAQEKIYYGTELPNNLIKPYPKTNYYGNTIEAAARQNPSEVYHRMREPQFYRQNEVIEGMASLSLNGNRSGSFSHSGNVSPQRAEGFHGEWGRGLYDSGLAGRHFVTTQRMKNMDRASPRSHNEIRTEWTMKGNNGMIYPGDNICQQPYKFWGDGYRGQYAYMPTGYEYNSYPHPYDNDAITLYGQYVTDYATGTNVANGPIIAQKLTGPLIDKNRIEFPGEFRQYHMPGELKQRALMQNAFPNTRSRADVCNRAGGAVPQHNPVDYMYKTAPQGVMQTNIAIFDDFIS